MIELKGRISSVQKLKGSVRAAPGKLASEVETYLLVTEDGQEIPAVTVAEEVVFTATANDIRAGTVAATSQGVTEGTKVIPSYQTMEGVQVIPAGSEFKITALSDNNMYDFTKLQALACLFNTSMSNSVSTIAVGINGKVYPVQSTTAAAEITKDHENKAVRFGVTNTYGTPCIIRYFTYREDN